MAEAVTAISAVILIFVLSVIAWDAHQEKRQKERLKAEAQKTAKKQAMEELERKRLSHFYRGDE